MNKKLGYLSCYLALPLLMAAALTTEVRADGETIAVFTKKPRPTRSSRRCGSAPITWRRR
ncbi:hypothetical protein ACVWWR_006235 [Bradyrhizobium sp. LM3.2]